MTDNNEILFEVETPLGFRVRVTVEYWQVIVTIKHPVMLGRETDVQDVLQNPDEIRLVRKTQAFICSTSPNESADGFAR